MSTGVKRLPLSAELPQFQPGYDMVIRRGDRAFAIFGDGSPEIEVSGDHIDEPFRERMRRAQPSILPFLRQRMLASQWHSLEGARERAAFIQGMIDQYGAARPSEKPAVVA